MIFPGFNSKELYHYLDPTLENGNFGNAIIHVVTNDSNNRDSSKTLQLVENLRKIAEKCLSYGIENVFISSVDTIKDLMVIFWNVLTHKLLNFVEETITVL